MTPTKEFDRYQWQREPIAPTLHDLRQWLADNPRHPDADRRREQLAKLEKAEGIRSNIAREGQASVDEPIYETTQARPLAHSIASAFGREIPAAVQVFTGYETARLRWMKPGPDGKLIPK